MTYPWTKETLEAFLTESAGEPVSVIEPYPVLLKKIPLGDRFGICGTAYVFRSQDGVVRAALHGWDPSA